MTERRKRCGIVHNFERFGTFSFKSDKDYAQFEVYACTKCGLSEFFILRIGKLAQEAPKEPKQEEWNPAIG